VDNRRFVHGVLWVLRSGMRWQDMPERYGKYKTSHSRVNGVAPGPIYPPLQISGGATVEHFKNFGSDYPLGRASQPCELASIYLQLAANDASYTTGNIYVQAAAKGSLRLHLAKVRLKIAIRFLRMACGHVSLTIALAALAGVGQGQGVFESKHSQATEKRGNIMNKSTAAEPTTSKPSIYQVVTDRIIDSLKNGIIPWQKPWKAPSYAGGSFPRNFRIGKLYRSVNILLLWSMPYSAPFWLTYKQPQELGGTVRKGEKVTQIVFYKQLHDKANRRAPSSTAAVWE